MRFDGYAGNVREVGFTEVAEVLAHQLGGVISRGRGVRRYADVLRVEQGGHCAVWVGRDTSNDCIYFEGKGETSPDLAAAIRKHWPGHTVSRADVCEDYDGEGVFERLQALVRDFKGPRVKGGYVALPDDSREGRTWTAGARGGVSYVRVYEAGKMAERAHYGKPHWVRIENEARPQYAKDKQAAATMEPLAFWGLSGWTHRLAEALCQVDIPRYEAAQRRYDFDRTTMYLARTFRKHWEEMLANGEDIVRTLQAVWEADDEAERSRTKARGTGPA